MELGSLHKERRKAFEKIVVEKKMVVRAYNKRVKNKSFQEGEMVWKASLPMHLLTTLTLVCKCRLTYAFSNKVL